MGGQFQRKKTLGTRLKTSPLEPEGKVPKCVVSGVDESIC